MKESCNLEKGKEAKQLRLSASFAKSGPLDFS